MDSKFPAKRLPAAFRFMAVLHGFSVLLLALSIGHTLVLETEASVSSVQGSDCFHPSDPLKAYCVCASHGESVQLVCKGLNSTQHFDLESHDSEKEERNDIDNDISGGSELPYEYKQSLYRDVSEILVKDSDIPYVILADFASYKKLQSLSVIDSHVIRVLQGRDGIPEEVLESITSKSVRDHPHSSVKDTASPKSANPAISGRSRSSSSPGFSMSMLTLLNVSGNKIRLISPSDIAGLPSLVEVNVSRNALGNPDPDLFSSLPKLEVLDLSSNQLNEFVNPKVFKQLPRGLSHLDISSKLFSALSFHPLRFDAKYDFDLPVIPGITTFAFSLHNLVGKGRQTFRSMDQNKSRRNDAIFAVSWDFWSEGMAYVK